jgi:hypothetical protein
MNLLFFLEVFPKSKSIKKVVFIFLLMPFVFNLQAQTSISGVVNTYAPVSNVSGNTVTVGSSSGSGRAWTVGDYVLVAQMTGNTSVNAGHYDLRRIMSVSGSNITLEGTSLTGRYDAGTEKVQLVYMPYSASGFTVTGTITPFAWDGNVGGIVGVITTGTITMNANIDASCRGFRATDTRLLTGGNIYYGGGGANGLFAGGASGGSYGIGGFRGGIRTITPQKISTNGSYRGGSGGVDDAIPFRVGGGGGGAGAGAGGGGGGGGDHSGGGGGGASPTTAGCGGRGTGDGTGGTGSINGVGGTNGSFVTSGGGCCPAGGGGGGSKYASGGGAGGNSNGFGYAGINQGSGGPSSDGGGGGAGGAGSAGIAGAAYTLSTNNYTNFLNTTDPRIQMGGSTEEGVSGGGIVLLKANSIAGNNTSILVDGCAGITGTSSLPSSGGGGAGTIMIDAINFTSSTRMSAVGGRGADGIGSTSAGVSNEASGGAGGGGGGAIWLNSATTSNNLNSNVSLPVVNNVIFNINGGASGVGGLAIKTGNIVASGGCGGAGIVYASPFVLGNICVGAGSIPPALTTTTINNVCPSLGVNLNTALSSSTPCPSTSSLEWHTTNVNLSASNKVSTPTSVNVSGVYYPVCYDATNNCYGQTPATGLTATIACCPGFGPTPTITKNTFTN